MNIFQVIFVKLKSFTVNNSVEKLRKTLLKLLKSYFNHLDFVKNSVEIVKNVKTLTCFNNFFPQFQFAKKIKYTN